MVHSEAGAPLFNWPRTAARSPGQARPPHTVTTDKPGFSWRGNLIGRPSSGPRGASHGKRWSHSTSWQTERGPYCTMCEHTCYACRNQTCSCTPQIAPLGPKWQLLSKEDPVDTLTFPASLHAPREQGEGPVRVLMPHSFGRTFWALTSPLLTSSA